MSTEFANRSAILRSVCLLACVVAETQFTANGAWAGGANAVDAWSPTSVSIQTISDAWHKRQAAVRTVRVAWGTRNVTIGVKEALSLPQRGRTLDAATSLKASLVTLESRSVLCLEDDKLSYTTDTPAAGQLDTPSPQMRMRVPTHFKLVLTETLCRKYTDRRADPLVSDAETAILSVKPSEKCDEVRLPEVRPLLLALRPLTSRLSSINLANYRVSAERGVVEERSCVILERIGSPPSSNRGGLKHSFWLDPARDYVVVRVLVRGKGQRMLQTDINYARDPVLGWMPTNWTTVNLDGMGHLEDAFHAKIDQFVPNQPIASVEFQNERPPSALAADRTEALQPASASAARSQDAKPYALTRLHFVIALNLLVLVAVAGFFAARRRNEPSRVE